MPTRRQLSKSMESQFEFPSTRRTDDPMYQQPKDKPMLNKEAEVREKIKQAAENLYPYGRDADKLRITGFEQGGEYGYSLALSELEQLKQWKELAMPMMSDFQEIGKALKVPLGQSIHDKILPGILKLVSELETFKEAYIERNYERNRLKEELEAARKENEELKKLVKMAHWTGWADGRTADVNAKGSLASWEQFAKDNHLQPPQ